MYFSWEDEVTGGTENFVVKPIRKFWNEKEHVAFYDSASKKTEFEVVQPHQKTVSTDPQKLPCGATNSNFCIGARERWFHGCQETSGAIAFYAYGYPSGASFNGALSRDRMGQMFMLQDSDCKISITHTLGKAGSSSGGNHVISYHSEALKGLTPEVYSDGESLQYLPLITLI